MGKAFLMGQSGIDTSDANAIVSDIFLNKTAYVDGNKITGTYVEPTGYEVVAVMSTRYGSTNISMVSGTTYEWLFTFATAIDISKIKNLTAGIFHDGSTGPYGITINSIVQVSPTSIRFNFTWTHGAVNIRPYLSIKGWRFTYA